MKSLKAHRLLQKKELLTIKDSVLNYLQNLTWSHWWGHQKVVDLARKDRPRPPDLCCFSLEADWLKITSWSRYTKFHIWNKNSNNHCCTWHDKKRKRGMQRISPGGKTENDGWFGGMGFYSEGPTRSDADCKEMQKSLKAPVAYSEKAVKDKI